MYMYKIHNIFYERVYIIDQNGLYHYEWTCSMKKLADFWGKGRQFYWKTRQDNFSNVT